MLHWTPEHIITEIKRLHTEGAALNYASAEKHHPNLVHAAARHFGTWQRAIEEAGINYETVRKYQRWNKDRIVKRIRELHAAGNDLSWRVVSSQLDPPLAFAAISPKGFGSWPAAISAAGLNHDQVARYKCWDKARVIEEIQALHRAGQPLSFSAMQRSNLSLLCAARRRFTSWDNALTEAGIDPAKVHLRSTTPR
jgi:Homing endonuclease associated repeat